MDPGLNVAADLLLLFDLAYRELSEVSLCFYASHVLDIPGCTDLPHG